MLSVMSVICPLALYIYTMTQIRRHISEAHITHCITHRPMLACVKGRNTQPWRRNVKQSGTTRQGPTFDVTHGVCASVILRIGSHEWVDA